MYSGAGVSSSSIVQDVLCHCGNHHMTAGGANWRLLVGGATVVDENSAASS